MNYSRPAPGPTPSHPISSFKRYNHNDINKSVFAAKVTEDDLSYVRSYWQREDVKVGDFIILKANGELLVFSEDDFLKNYHRPGYFEKSHSQHIIYKGEKRL